MEESVFTRIIKGEVPTEFIYEDDRTVAFLDNDPLADGHVLVVSKKQLDPLWEMSDEDYAAMWSTARKVARRVQEVLNPLRVGSIVEGFGVAHAHIHVVPLYNRDIFRLHHGYPVHTAPEDFKEIAAKLKF